jgi:surface antigen
MVDRLARRQFLGAITLAAAAVPLALALPGTSAAAGECDLEDRDLRPHKGFASTRPDSGGQCTTHAARRFDTVAPDPGVNWRGNAAYWYDNADAAGWVVGRATCTPLARAPWSSGAVGPATLRSLRT